MTNRKRTVGNMKTIDVITMGCSKNLVDSEHLMGQLEALGFRCTHDAERPRGEIAVVNTCGFIADAKEESINEILRLAQAKSEGRLERLYVMGCLSQRYREELQREIPEVDKYFGKFDWTGLAEELQSLGGRTSQQAQRHLTTPAHYAYIKVSEGCDRHCAYCAIPLITGRHVSRPMEDILDEVRRLVERGVKEFQLIAQELTFYGEDLYGRQTIAELVDRMAQIPGVKWIRLHYAYPTKFPWDLLPVMARHANVCKYLDIALQHISDRVLERMKRNVTRQQTMELIARIRREVPGIHLRTTLLVGFPGETDEDFEELVAFVREVRFERMGAFAYSEEEGTYSAQHYVDDVPEDVKQSRLDRLMAVQQRISAQVEAQKVGQTLTTIIDRYEGGKGRQGHRHGGYYVGRTEFCSPEVDPEVLVKADEGDLKTGEFYQVRINDSEEFDLYGTIEDKGV